MTRAEVEKLLDQHHILFGHADSCRMLCQLDHRASFIHALCALPDRPGRGSREALKVALDRYNTSTQEHLFAPRFDAVLNSDFLDTLLAWQRGERETTPVPTWCEHMRYETTVPCRWVYLTTLRAADLFHFCPICGTPKP